MVRDEVSSEREREMDEREMDERETPIQCSLALKTVWERPQRQTKEGGWKFYHRTKVHA